MELFAVGSDSGSHGFFLLRKAIFRKNAQAFRSPKAERSATRTGAEGMKPLATPVIGGMISSLFTF
jgi:hypothetical protein